MSDAQPCGAPGEARVGGLRPGGRSERVRRAVLEATGRVLLEKGFQELSIADIAAEASVHPSTIYRRWGDKGSLVLEAITDISSEAAPSPDTGSLEGDLRQLIQIIAESLANERFRELARSLVSLSGEYADEARVRYWSARFAIGRQIIERAVARGEIADSPHAWEAIEAAGATIWMRALISGARIDEELVERLVERALASVGAAPLQAA